MQQDDKDDKTPSSTWSSLHYAVTERGTPAPGTTQGLHAETLARSRSDKALQAARRLLELRTVVKERFLLEDILGSGGMGTVFKARDLRKVEARDRAPWVAIKLLNDDFKNYPAALISLQREARKSQALAHPNIIKVFDFDRDDEVVFMTMEFLQGRDLNQYIQENPRGVGLAETLRITREMGSALQHAHENQVIHADFTPKNIFLTNEGKIKVLDFGIAQAVELVDTQASEGDDTAFDPASLGGLTRAYASQDRLHGLTPVATDDVYALGCIVYQLLSGVHPYKGRSALEAESLGIRPARISSLRARQWRGLQNALALAREDRYQSVQEFLDVFCPASHSLGKYSLLAGSLVLLAIAILGYQSLLNYQHQHEQEAELLRQKQDYSAREKEQSLVAQAAVLERQRSTVGYLDLAETLLEQDRYDEAQLYLQRVRGSAPEHPRLAPLQQRLNDLADRARQTSRLFEQADEYILAGALVRPANANAYASYQQILALDPDNEQLMALQQRLTQSLLDRLERTVRKGELQRAVILFRDLQQIAPDNPYIPRFDATLKKAVLESQQRKLQQEALSVQTEALLAQAEGLAGESLVGERRRIYRDVLVVDPGNLAALRGLELANAEISRIELQQKQQSRKNAEALLLHAEQLLGKRPATPDNFARARELLQESARQSPDFTAAVAQLEQLPQHYVDIIRQQLAEENYADAERYLQAAIVLAPQNPELARLREALDALGAREQIVVPISF